MNGPPTFGLLVPCRNGALFLPRLFASARAQTRAFDEVWLFDDGSDDRSGEVAREWGAKILRSEQSIGPSAARNRLMAACACDWLHFHDADDSMDPHYLEKTAAQIRPETDVVICDMIWVEETTGKVDNRWRYDGAALARHPASYLLLNTVGGINGLYRRSTLAAVSGFDEQLKFWEDLDLSLRLARHGAKTEVINEDLVTAYRRGASYSNSNLGEVWRAKLRLMDRLMAGADAELRATIAREAETIAERLARLGRWMDIPAALQLACQAGGDPPTTRNPLLRILKRVLPRAWAFRFQSTLRRRLAR